MLADMHLHSCFSDGTRTPEQIAEALQQAGIGLAALADHNTTQGHKLFDAACSARGIATIRAAELDCVYDGRVIHLLCYGFEPEGRIMTLADHSKRLLLEMSRDLVKRMAADFPHLSLADYDQYEYDRTLGGWKGLHYLCARQITRKLEDGMRLYGQYGCDYSNYPFPSVNAVCAAVREASGVPVLAHPANWFASCTPAELGGHLEALRVAGIGGVECYYPSHTARMTAACLAFCSHHNLLVTAGSDCHGAFAERVGEVAYHIGAIRVDTEKLRLGKLLRTAI